MEWLDAITRRLSDGNCSPKRVTAEYCFGAARTPLMSRNTIIIGILILYTPMIKSSYCFIPRFSKSMIIPNPITSHSGERIHIQDNVAKG